MKPIGVETIAVPLSDCAVGARLFQIPVFVIQVVPLPCESNICTLLVTVPGSFNVVPVVA